LRDAEIQHSVVLESSRIIGVHNIQDSLLGREVDALAAVYSFGILIAFMLIRPTGLLGSPALQKV